MIKGAGLARAIQSDSFPTRPRSRARPRESEFYRGRGTSTRTTTKSIFCNSVWKFTKMTLDSCSFIRVSEKRVQRFRVDVFKCLTTRTFQPLNSCMKLHIVGTANRRKSKGGIALLSLFLNRQNSLLRHSTFIIRNSIFAFSEFLFRFDRPFFWPATGLNPEP